MGERGDDVSLMDRWARLVATRIDPRPLAATRLLVALAALVWLRTLWPRFDTGFDPSRMHIGWSLVGDRLVDLPPAVPRALWLVGALVLASGVAARVGAASLAAGVALWLAVDRQHYANGSYFLLLVALLLVLVDSGGAWTPWGPVRRRIEWWPPFLLACQLSIVYGWAAVQKFRVSALQGHTVDWQLQGPLADAVTWSLLPVALNLVGGLIEAFCAVGLWFARTRAWAIAAGIGLHIGIVLLVRGTGGLVFFGILSIAIYPAYSVVAPPLARSLRPTPPYDAVDGDRRRPGVRAADAG